MFHKDWERMAKNDYINGFIVPPVFVEHMDDPWSPYYSGMVSEIRKMRGTVTDEKAWEFHLAVVREVLDGPWEVKHYRGWRGRLRSRANRLRRQLSKIWFGEKPPGRPMARDKHAQTD